MAMEELLLCKVNDGWHKAGSAAGFALLEAVLVKRKQGVYQGQKRGGSIVSAVKKCSVLEHSSLGCVDLWK